ncbi:hypothetical protein G7046_g8298 [Stylonectria norvegica]|nr:hypothetical protein G7046_g8298 [Stylonectria norvegica]
MPLRLGDHVFVGRGSVVQAATVGNHVHIGNGCTVGEFAIIKDYVKILDGTVVPGAMVIPSFSIVAGQPARVVGEIPEGGHDEFELRELYKTASESALAFHDSTNHALISHKLRSYPTPRTGHPRAAAQNGLDGVRELLRFPLKGSHTDRGRGQLETTGSAAARRNHTACAERARWVRRVKSF